MPIGSSIVVLGRKRTGKTYLIKKFLIPKFRKAYDYIYIFDVNHSYDDLKKKRGIIHDFPHSANRKDELNKFCKRVLLEHKGKLKMLIVDEVQMFVNNQNLDSIPNFLYAVTVGGNHRIGNCCATQRPATMNKTILSSADTSILFHMESGADKSMLRENYPVKVAKEVVKLRGHEFILYISNGGWVKSELK